MAEERHVRVVRPFSPVIGAALTPSRDAALRERFQAKACPGLDPGWKPVRVKKTRQIKNLEPRFDSIETEKALASRAAARLVASVRRACPGAIRAFISASTSGGAVSGEPELKGGAGLYSSRS